jgi:hypothetical protein
MAKSHGGAALRLCTRNCVIEPSGPCVPVAQSFGCGGRVAQGGSQLLVPAPAETLADILSRYNQEPAEGTSVKKALDINITLHLSTSILTAFQMAGFSAAPRGHPWPATISLTSGTA